MRLGQPWSVERMKWEAVDPLTLRTNRCISEWHNFILMEMVALAKDVKWGIKLNE